MLSCYRVLDLTNGKGYLCGKVLGELGADVIKIEPPGGDPDRDTGPFYHDQVDREKSLFWFSFNANKRGITLNINTKDGQEIFKRLVKTADVVIESFKPGHMDEIGLGYSVLSEVNPGIVLTSISSFGQEGPYRDYKAPDIVLRAMSGLIFTVGDPDRPPLTTGNEHSYHVGAMHGAIGTVVALYQRSFTGRGQIVDAPAQMGLVFVGSTEQQLPWILQHQIPQRQGRERFAVQLNDGSTYLTPILWPCKDGDISFTLASAAMAASAATIIESIKKDGIDSSSLERWDWSKVHEGEWSKADIDAILDTLHKYFSLHSKAELLQLSLDKGIHLGICLNVAEALKFPQFVARDFWQEVEHPELQTKIVYPSNFIKFSNAESNIRFRAPLIGEHNAEILGKELGISSADLVTLKQGHVI
jgi:benzylsuccinate CoA-transferase BbsE subunit